MSIVFIPPEVPISNPLACSICRVKLLLDKATAGLSDANNQQAFACVSHFSEVELLIIGWADFIADERYKYLRQKQTADVLYGEVGKDVWLNS